MLRCRSLAIYSFLVAAIAGASGSAPPLVAQASQATVSGVVLDAARRSAVEGAEIAVLGTNRRAITSELGEFLFDGLNPGFIVLQIEHPGYRSRTDTLGVAPGERVEVRLTVTVQAIELEPISVVSRRNTMGTGITGRFPGMTRTEIDEVGPRAQNLVDLVQNTRLAVSVARTDGVGEGGSYCVEHPRARTSRFEGRTGQGVCLSMNVYVDGRLQLDPRVALADMPPDNIERFEVVPPVEAMTLYGEAGARGVILVETRSGTGVTERRLPAYERDDAPVTFALSLLGSFPASVYSGQAVFTYQDAVTNTRYDERESWRIGLRAAVRIRPVRWFPELELSGFLLDGSADASFVELGQGAVEHLHDFRTVGVELAARPRLTRGPRWDLSFLVGPVFAWERFDVVAVEPFATAPGLSERLAGHLNRSWSTVGVVVGADFEFVLHPKASLLVGGRLRGLTLGEPGMFITQAQAADGLDALQLPQSKNRSGRRTLEIGMSVRPGS